ncbi:RagB/SusD family nutrient uptake outer membrane protein [Cellulophaga sp. F20128]|uniref:RagB/SusD family nutrient uptake outer membrane protein n=1 Tax=Cellulophaga sp. F20128 TaxID=2926413 RepID=UPI001FF4C140|nr:RagB/SusD family nutrient uptake outer membrane protein [Cellulophaga sp. F20128]MCK0158032.1 RagB/SusD family nutrient uptake outer membrane protein [Cellulophaga sp. F20128]
MKKNKIYIAIIFIAGILSSCEKDYLNVVPDNVATIDNAFSNRFNTQKFLYTIYGSIPDPGTVNNPALNGGDEIWYPESERNRAGVRIAQGFQSATQPSYNLWNDGLYEGIRNCNIFLSRIDDVQGIQSYEKTIWTAEVNFLKAYFHFYLLRMYGPIVINDELIPVSAATGDINSNRSSVEETFTYIIDLLDDAILELPLELQNPGDELGRVTKPIAAAMKARVLMTYASPLFNGNSVYSGFVNAEGEPFFPATYSPEKWENAAVATKEAIDICHDAGIRLFQKEDYINRSGNAITSDITLLKAGLRSRMTEKWNFELVWGHTASTNNLEYEAMPRLYNYINNPVASRHCPPLRIAEMYYSKNGVPIEEDVTYDYANRYKLRSSLEADKYQVEEGQSTVILNFDRETRFYADLSFDRGVWYGNGANDEANPWFVHARGGEFASVFEISQYSVTGYWPKKLVAIPTQVNTGQSLSTTRYAFPIIRLADLYLYYAEALNESKTAPDAQVYEYIDLVRERAGLSSVVDSWSAFSSNPSKPTTKNGMREIIQQERMIEMSFEGARFWDLRRWKLAKDYMNKPIKGWNVLENDADDYYTIRTLYNPTYSEKDYLWPIPETETIKDPSLIQNPGW